MTESQSGFYWVKGLIKPEVAYFDEIKGEWSFINSTASHSNITVLSERLAEPNLTWLETLPTLSPREQLKTLFREIGPKRGEMNFDRIDFILRGLDLTIYVPEVVMAFFRITAVIKHKLPHWQQCRDNAYAELESRGLPAKDIMVGL